VIDAYILIHRRILEFAENLSDEQIAWQLRPGTLTIAFYLWHLGRWADHLQAAIPGMTEELSRRLAPRPQVWSEMHNLPHWQSIVGELGYAETGMYMDEAAAADLPFPAKQPLLEYVKKTFDAVEQALQAVDESDFGMEELPQPITEGIWSPGSVVGGAILSHLVHDNRHLGMMECLVGLQVGAGSATV